MSGLFVHGLPQHMKLCPVIPGTTFDRIQFLMRDQGEPWQLLQHQLCTPRPQHRNRKIEEIQKSTKLRQRRPNLAQQKKSCDQQQPAQFSSSSSSIRTRSATHMISMQQPPFLQNSQVYSSCKLQSVSQSIQMPTNSSFCWSTDLLLIQSAAEMHHLQLAAKYSVSVYVCECVCLSVSQLACVSFSGSSDVSVRSICTQLST